MEAVGQLSKLGASKTTPVSYQFIVGGDAIPLNEHVGKKLSLSYQKIICMGCAKDIKKTYQDGYCFVCTQKLARCDFCILKPERCHYHLGTCREPKWGESHCMIKHIVYLANASGPKVGITRFSNVPNRWIDQGAFQALPLFEAKTRRISGYIEVEIAKHLSDKTNWRKMLYNQIESCDLFELRKQILEKIPSQLDNIAHIFGDDSFQLIQDPTLYTFEYPVKQYPTKINSLSFEKTKKIEGTLLGIKGQYLILDTGVFNVRKHSGYVVSLEI